MGVRERLKQFIEYKGISKYKFYKDLGLSNGFLDKEGNIGSDKCEKIIYQYPELNMLWLLTGQGEMLLSSSAKSINEGNNIVGHGNQIAGGNIGFSGGVNITMPESGTQKIIKPSGEVEIQRTDSTKSEGTKEAELYKEIELLKQEVALVKDNMKVKDELIASLRDTIELLRNRQ